MGGYEKMKQITYVVANPLGIHARPAALLAQCCVDFKSAVTIEKALSKLVDEGRIQLITRGRYSKYFRV